MQKIMETMNPDPGHKLLYVKTKEATLRERGGLYESARKYWRVSPSRARKADYVIAVIDNVCRGVFRPETWKPCEGKDQGRWQFEGREVSGAVAKGYVGKLVPENIRGGRYPVRYGY